MNGPAHTFSDSHTLQARVRSLCVYAAVHAEATVMVMELSLVVAFRSILTARSSSCASQDLIRYHHLSLLRCVLRAWQLSGAFSMAARYAAASSECLLPRGLRDPLYVNS